MDHAELLKTRKVYELTRLKQLEDWFEARLQRPVQLEIMEGSALRNGFSGETIFLREKRGLQPEKSYILRQESVGSEVSFPPGGDFLLEAQVQRALGRKSRVPVPPILGIESDDTVIGRKFYVMDVVPGEVPCDNPGYHSAGSVAALSPSNRRELALSGVETLGELGKLDPKDLDVPGLWRAAPGRSEIEWDIDYYRNFWRWAQEDLRYPRMDEALDWLERNAPRNEPLTISWGDARYGNIIFGHTRTAALIDWEMVTLGSPEKDLSFWLMMDEMYATMIASQPLEGWPSEAEMTAAYERRLGRSVDEDLLAFYRLFTSVRLTAIFSRFVNIMRHRGAFPHEMTLDAATAPVIRLLDRELRRATT
jgi:aminoglycoside phosphotransferase (APT) family kinase protein